MINTSQAFKEAILKNRIFRYKAELAFKDGSILTLTDPKLLMQNGISIKDSCSGDSTFDIGAVVINELSLKLNNSTKEFDGLDFEDAEVAVWIGLVLPDHTTEFLKKGNFTVDESKTTGNIITLTCLDNMAKFDRLYSESKLVYPATVLEIVLDACEVCGVSMASAAVPNGSYVVNERPEGDSVTFREIISWSAQIGGCFAKADTNGRLAFGWYDEEAEGHSINRIASQEISLSDITITGIKVVENTEEEAAYLAGEEGYVLVMEGNQLIGQGKSKEVAQYLASKIGGLTFRTMKISCLSDPSMEAGDKIRVTDRKGNEYTTFITSTTFQIGNHQKIECNAETPSKKKASRPTSNSKLLDETKKEAAEQIKQYDLSMKLLANLQAQSLGLFKTEEKQEDGSVIYYMHNKPLLEDSDKIWKMSANAFTVSADGGKTWNAGCDSEGNATLNALSVIGIQFDWAKGGVLTLGGSGNGNGVLKVFDENGKQIGLISKDGIQMAAGSIDSIDKKLEDLKGETASKMVVQYALSDSPTTAPEEGWSKTAPAWQDGKFMWQKTVVTFANGGTSESKPTCISGATGQSGEDATYLFIDSSNGNVFKNSNVSTEMNVIIMRGAKQITDTAALRNEYGASAHLAWKWKRIGDTAFKAILSTDNRLSNDGFTFTLSPDDVDVKVVFHCDLEI